MKKRFTTTLDISTHTLTWSVTVCCIDTADVGIISTHTLTWSVTLRTQFAPNTAQDFNSHAHVERDPQGNPTERREGISTHTLTWSVTLAQGA